ncbi:hypothetical protein C8Q76DRAFT_308769 [Earliella scabrosa]|nr:hypothetical protein C8Q76DRAFT_308769 [Earliella scabrosa]
MCDRLFFYWQVGRTPSGGLVMMPLNGRAQRCASVMRRGFIAERRSERPNRLGCLYWTQPCGYGLREARRESFADGERGWADTADSEGGAAPQGSWRLHERARKHTNEAQVEFFVITSDHSSCTNLQGLREYQHEAAIPDSIANRDAFCHSSRKSRARRSLRPGVSHPSSLSPKGTRRLRNCPASHFSIFAVCPRTSLIGDDRSYPVSHPPNRPSKRWGERRTDPGRRNVLERTNI